MSPTFLKGILKKGVPFLVMIGTVLILADLLIPRPLPSYFGLSTTPDDGSIVQLFEENKQVDLTGVSLERIWAAVQKVKVHYAGTGRVFSDEGDHYVVCLRSYEPAILAAFHCTGNGYLLVEDRKYQITAGEDELITAIRDALE